MISAIGPTFVVRLSKLMSREIYLHGNFTCVQKMLKSNCLLPIVLACTLYTAQLWTNHTMADIYGMHVAYNNTCRLLFGLSRRCSASEMFAVRHVAVSRQFEN